MKKWNDKYTSHNIATRSENLEATYLGFKYDRHIKKKYRNVDLFIITHRNVLIALVVATVRSR